MTPNLLVTFAAVGVLSLVSGCAHTTSNEKFLEMTRSCISPQLLGPSGEIVFFGPSEYRPGDVFKRAADVSGVWRYSAEFEYAANVESPTLAKVVKSGSVPVECKLTQDTSVQFDIGAEGNATLTKAAVPLAASAGLSLKNGTVSSISAHKLFVDSVPYLQPYSESIASLPAGSPLRKAISDGGYFVATATLVIDGYAVDVKYGPEFDARATAQATLPTGNLANLKANVSLQAKDANTLTYLVQGKTVVGIVARPISADFTVQGVGGPSSESSKPTIGILAKRSWQ